MGEHRPIFVCGPSRSGTALVRSILNGHPSVHLAGETHYFDDLRGRVGERCLRALTAAERRVTEDYFLALAHRPYGHEGDPEKSRHSRAALQAEVAKVGGEHPGSDHYLEAFCRLEATSNGATVWGEKTPRHVFRIPDILSVFPTARVICLSRDARAVVASYRDWRNQGGFDFANDPGHEQTLTKDHERARRSYHPIIISMLWKGALNAAFSAYDTFGAERVRVQRYEDLVDEPESSIHSLAKWAGLDFTPDMCQVPMHNSSYTSFNKQGGVSAAPRDRWRKQLSSAEIAAVEQVCGPLLTRAGYELMRPRGVGLHVAGCWLSFPLVAARATLANRQRIANLPDYVWRRLKPSKG